MWLLQIALLAMILRTRACALLNNCFAKAGHGKCAPDATKCICNAGFLGDSCSLEPALLAPGSVVPGFVSNGGASYFRVNSQDFNLGDEVVVESSVGTVTLFGSIGVVPSPDSAGIFTFQFKSVEADDAPRKTFKLQTLNSLGGPDNQNLYVAVQAVNVVRGNGVEFELFHWKGKSERIFSTDVDDWAVFVCLALAFIVCVAACVLGVVYCIASKGDDDLYDEYQGQTALQRQRANQEAEEKARKLYGADYPVSNSNGGATMQPPHTRSATVHSAHVNNTGGTFSSTHSGGSFQQPPRHLQTFAGPTTTAAAAADSSHMMMMDAGASQYDGGMATRGRLTSATSFFNGEHDAQW